MNNKTGNTLTTDAENGLSVQGAGRGQRSRSLSALLIRGLDFSSAAVALILMSPLLLVVILILRFTGEREIFFLQERVGKDGKVFRLLKFATMLKDSPNLTNGTMTVKNDPRVLPFGRFLRKTKINELPQLVNVLRGDMGLIGPRPQSLDCFDLYTPSTKARLIQVRPGLSGAGSVIFRNEEDLLDKNDSGDSRFYEEVITPYKGKVEVWYVENQGFRNYLRFLVLTIAIVVFPRMDVGKFLPSSIPEPPEQLKGKLFGF